MLDIESIVFSRIKFPVFEKLKTTYPDLNFTTNSKSTTEPKFPCVYIHLLPAAETGQDLEGLTINAGIFTFQIDVFDNQSQDRAQTVMTEVVNVMKSMRFEVNAFPEFQNTESAYRSVSRFRRVIGSGDIL